MKFLHTSDWHIGRTIRGKPRWEEQERALQQVLAHAKEQGVDCVLVAGDVFDTSSPPAEAEEIVYGFFRELFGMGIPAAVIAGNHDHPIRLDALSQLLRALNIHALGEPVGLQEGARLELPSRDGKETAEIVAVPWITERRAVEFVALAGHDGAPIAQYADRVSLELRTLASGFRPDTCNVMLAHIFTQNAIVGPGGGERELHLSLGIYGINPQQLPPEPQYLALGHVHKAQAVRKSPAAWYSGSLLQLDFGETRQEKSVNLIEIHPRRPAEVTQLPITAGRQLLDVGTAAKGVRLNELAEYAEKAGDAWLRVFVDVDMPVANLPALVRETLPNAVSVERAQTGAPPPEHAPMAGLRPEELFETFYRSDLGRGKEPAKETLELFRRLLDEVTSAAPQT